MTREFATTAEIPMPQSLIDQVIGQDEAVAVIRQAARQRRSVLLVGEPGTGKSLIGRALAELLPTGHLQDLLAEPNPADRNRPRMVAVPAGTGAGRLAAARRARQAAEGSLRYLVWLASAAALAIGTFHAVNRSELLPMVWGLLAGGVLLGARRHLQPAVAPPVPNLLVSPQGAPFIEATGARDGALFGDVRHDPYQSGGKETPIHELIEPGAIHRAHGGVLFIDEVATLDWETQQHLLTAFQEKQLAITGRNPGSSGTMVRTEPAPCDFVLVLAGNRHDVERLHPALRSRVRGYGYEVFTRETMPDTPDNRSLLVRFVAQEVRADGRIPHFSRTAVEDVLADAARRAGRPGHLTMRLRELGGLVRAAGDAAVAAGAPVVEPEHVATALTLVRPLEQQMAVRSAEVLAEQSVTVTAPAPGRLLTAGWLAGVHPCAARLEAVAVPAGAGDAVLLGSLADAFAGGSALWPVLCGAMGEVLTAKVYVGGAAENLRFGRAPAAVALAALSALLDQAIPLGLAVVGEVSLRGEWLPVPRTAELVDAVGRAGARVVLVPAFWLAESAWPGGPALVPVRDLRGALECVRAVTA